VYKVRSDSISSYSLFKIFLFSSFPEQDVFMKRNFPRVIGLYSPREQSGKSTIVEHLQTQTFKNAGMKLVHIKISAPLKQPLYDLGLTDDDIEGRLKEVPNIQLGGKTPRQAMIDAYKKGAAKEGADWLSKRAATLILEALCAGTPVVVDDVRTPEDYDMIRVFTASEVWRVYRPKDGENNIGSSADIEGMLEDKFFNFKIANNGSLEDLYRILDQYFPS
jgi:hypothetical protein